MKLINTTELPDRFLRRLVSWCCRELGLPVKRVREAAFRHGQGGGLAYFSEMRFGVRVVRYDDCPGEPDVLKRYDVDWLVKVTAHEAAHLYQRAEGTRTRHSRRYRTVRGGGSERDTRWHENLLYERFCERRAALLEEWMREPERAAAAPSLSLVERRAEHARGMLARWEKKLRAAERLVKKWRRKVAYYARRGEGGER